MNVPYTRSWPHWPQCGCTVVLLVWLCVDVHICVFAASYQYGSGSSHHIFNLSKLNLRCASQICVPELPALLFIASDAISVELNSLPDKTFHSIYRDPIPGCCAPYFIFESRILLPECVSSSVAVSFTLGKKYFFII